jgi:hypothetical protein
MFQAHPIRAPPHRWRSAFRSNSTRSAFASVFDCAWCAPGPGAAAILELQEPDAIALENRIPFASFQGRRPRRAQAGRAPATAALRARPSRRADRRCQARAIRGASICDLLRDPPTPLRRDAPQKNLTSLPKIAHACPAGRWSRSQTMARRRTGSSATPRSQPAPTS